MSIHRKPIGKKRWAIAEGYIPAWSSSDRRELESHETACLLNASEQDANVTITIFYAKKPPSGPYNVRVPAGRTLHLRFNELRDPEPIPTGEDFSSVIESDVPIVVQHTRLDSRTPDVALMTTAAYGE
jgi:hypothetical protein